MKLKRNKGIVFWITGLSGSGKTTIGKKIKAGIIKNYGPTILFSGDDIRKIFANKKMGTLIYTGASASLRGKANFGAFNSGKAALRILAQAMSKEYGPQGVHISHIIIDGAIGGEKIWKKNPDYAKKLGKEGLINLDGIVESYVYLYNQPKEAWTFELDLRTSIEKW